MAASTYMNRQPSLPRVALLWLALILVPTTCAFKALRIRQGKWNHHRKQQTLRLDDSSLRSIHASDTIHSHADAEYSYQRLSQMDQRGGAIYRQSIFSNDEFSTIQKELSLLTNRLNDETSSTIAVSRQGARLSPDSQTFKILESGTLLDYLKKVSGDDSMRLSQNLPVEVRLYEKAGACMAWHEDDVLYDPPQIEAVITIENNSDCVTMWKENGEKLSSRETDPNSVLLLKAGGPLHCVTSLKRGRRLILKCAFRTENATFQEGIYTETFGASKVKGKKGKKQKSKR